MKLTVVAVPLRSTLPLSLTLTHSLTHLPVLTLPLSHPQEVGRATEELAAYQQESTVRRVGEWLEKASGLSTVRAAGEKAERCALRCLMIPIYMDDPCQGLCLIETLM